MLLLLQYHHNNYLQHDHIVVLVLYQRQIKVTLKIPYDTDEGNEEEVGDVVATIFHRFPQ